MTCSPFHCEHSSKKLLPGQPAPSPHPRTCNCVIFLRAHSTATSSKCLFKSPSLLLNDIAGVAGPRADPRLLVEGSAQQRSVSGSTQQSITVARLEPSALPATRSPSSPRLGPRDGGLNSPKAVRALPVVARNEESSTSTQTAAQLVDLRAWRNVRSIGRLLLRRQSYAAIMRPVGSGQPQGSTPGHRQPALGHSHFASGQVEKPHRTRYSHRDTWSPIWLSGESTGEPWVRPVASGYLLPAGLTRTPPLHHGLCGADGCATKPSWMLYPPVETPHTPLTATLLYQKTAQKPCTDSHHFNWPRSSVDTRCL